MGAGGHVSIGTVSHVAVRILPAPSRPSIRTLGAALPNSENRFFVLPCRVEALSCRFPITEVSPQ